LEIPKSFLIELRRDTHGPSFTFHPRAVYTRPFDRAAIMASVKRAVASSLRGEHLGWPREAAPKVMVGRRPPKLPDYHIVGWKGKADRDNLKFF
jgi:hypothetical protein